jgi:hypothetical protein
VIRFDSAAQGSCTWIRPSAANGVRTSEPFEPSSYVPCWKKTTAWMQLGFELFELKRYWASSKKPSSVLQGGQAGRQAGERVG